MKPRRYIYSMWNMLCIYTAKLLVQVPHSSFVPTWQRGNHIASQLSHDEVPMVYHQLLVCREGNFVVQP